MDPRQRSLITVIESLDLEIRVSGGLVEQDWLELLRDSLPGGFSSLFILADVPAASRDITACSKWLNILIDLIAPLQTMGLYLKVFAPEELRSRIAERENRSGSIIMDGGRLEIDAARENPGCKPRKFCCWSRQLGRLM